MVLDGGTTIASTVGTAANVTLRISQIIYELKAVGEATQDLLDSTNHISATLDTVRTLRRQQSRQLSTPEKKWIDVVCADTDKCLRNVAALVEPARVDLQTKSGKIGFVNRSLWVIRDSPKVASNLARLNLTNQSLNSAMTVLCTRGTPVVSKIPVDTATTTPNSERRESRALPPSYNESEFLNRRRMGRNASRLSLIDDKHQERPASLRSTTSSLTLSPQISSEPAWGDKLMAELGVTDTAVKHTTVPIIEVEEIGSPCSTYVEDISPPLPDPYKDSDGLQAVEDTSTHSQLAKHQTYDLHGVTDGSDGLQVVQNDFEGLQVVEYQTYSPHSLSPMTRPSLSVISEQHQHFGGQSHPQWRSPENLAAFEFAPPSSASPSCSSYHRGYDELGLPPVQIPPNRTPSPGNDPLYSIPLVADVARRAHPVSIPAAERADKAPNGPQRQDNLPQPRSPSAKPAPTRIKSKGRRWLESQSEL